MTEEDQNNVTTTRAESPSSTDPESLSAAVRLQVEYYFSKENLRTDTFLQSKMDAQNAVPLATVMAFPKILSLTRDTQVVIKSLESSSVVALVDGKIKPKGSGRSTIILREIPSDSSEESIREIFNYSGARSIASIRSEIGDTWFVTMESEEDAKDTIMDLKLKKRCFNGVPVKARLKTDAGIRAYYSAGAVLPLAYPGMTFQPYGMVDTTQSGAGYNYETTSPSPTSPQSKEKALNGGSSYRGKEGGSEGGDGDSNGRRDGKDRGSNRNPKPNNGSNRKQGGGPNGKGLGRDRKDNVSAPPPPPIEINSAADFPPLAPPSHPSSTENDQPVAIPPQGYQGPFVRYSIDEILVIVSGIKDATLPNSIQLADHTAALMTSPNTDLLLRQRTFSIDETREQMQLGRPVQREAVITGAVDYGSFIYGELDNSGHGEPSSSSKGVAKAAAGVGGGSWAGVLMKSGPPPPQTDLKPTNKGSDKTAAGAAAAVPATASTPSGTKTDGKKSNEKKVGAKPGQEGGASAKKEGAPKQQQDESKKTKRRRGSHGDHSAKGSEEEEKTGTTAAAPVPSSWGGRPTFANILKQQEEAAAEAAAAGATPPTSAGATTPSNPAPVTATKKPNSQTQQPSAAGAAAHRAQGGPKNNDNKGVNKPPPTQTAQQAKKPMMTNPDGTWVRDKLPPR